MCHDIFVPACNHHNKYKESFDFIGCNLFQICVLRSNHSSAVNH